MPIIVPGTGSSPTSTLTAQDIVNCTSQDIRSLLPTTSTVLLDYVNRVSLDLLRHSRWRFLLSGVKTFQTTVGETDYHIGTGAAPAGSTDVNLDLDSIRSIKADSVFDRDNHRRLKNTEEVPLGTFFTSNGQPKLWRFDQDSSTVLSIYPPADAAYDIEFRYYEKFNVVDELTDNLQIPEDYKDIMCAGVNWMASKFLKLDEDTSHWLQVYQLGKQQIIRDYNLFPRNGEFIAPDTAAVSTVFPLSIDNAGNF